MSWIARIVACALALSAPAGCAYRLDGKVVDGFGSATVGRNDDADARRGGIGGATVELVRDAGTMNRSIAARATSGSDGRFTLDVQGFGAGWMEERWQVRVRRNGCENVESELSLPSSTSGRLLIVTMARGRSAPFRDPDTAGSLIDEARQYERSPTGDRP
ncbi:MAG: hypothetical protein ACKOEL_11115 [Planctomycetota bacterium]